MLSQINYHILIKHSPLSLNADTFYDYTPWGLCSVCGRTPQATGQSGTGLKDLQNDLHNVESLSHNPFLIISITSNICKQNGNDFEENVTLINTHVEIIAAAMQAMFNVFIHEYLIPMRLRS